MAAHLHSSTNVTSLPPIASLLAALTVELPAAAAGTPGEGFVELLAALDLPAVATPAEALDVAEATVRPATGEKRIDEADPVSAAWAAIFPIPCAPPAPVPVALEAQIADELPVPAGQPPAAPGPAALPVLSSIPAQTPPAAPPGGSENDEPAIGPPEKAEGMIPAEILKPAPSRAALAQETTAAPAGVSECPIAETALPSGMSPPEELRPQATRPPTRALAASHPAVELPADSFETTAMERAPERPPVDDAPRPAPKRMAIRISQQPSAAAKEDVGSAPETQARPDDTRQSDAAPESAPNAVVSGVSTDLDSPPEMKASPLAEPQPFQVPPAEFPAGTDVAPVAARPVTPESRTLAPERPGPPPIDPYPQRPTTAPPAAARRDEPRPARVHVAFAARLTPAGPETEPSRPVSSVSEVASRENRRETAQQEPAGSEEPTPRLPRRDTAEPAVERTAITDRAESPRAATTVDAPKPGNSGDEVQAEAPAPKVAAPRRETPLPPPLARDIRLELAGPDKKVEVRLTERAGEVRFAVRTPDGRLAESLRENLPLLSSRLEQSGFRADEWRAAAAGSSERRLDVHAGAGASAGSGEQRHPQDGGQERRDGEPRPPRDIDDPKRSKEKGAAFAWLMQSLR